MTTRGRVVYTDASVRAGITGIAVTAAGFARSRRFAGSDTVAAELRAVLYAMELFPRAHLIIVCDSSTIRNGAGRLPRHRSRNFGGPNCGPLWEEYERRKEGRRVAIIAPKHKDTGLHGRAHHLARAAATPEEPGP